MSTLTFTPIRRTVQSITRANPAVVTTTANHGYLDGIFVRFFFPANFGMNLLNGEMFQATILSPTTFSIPLNTTAFDAFDSSLSTTQTPQVIPVAEIASTLANREKNNLTPIGGF